MTTLYLIRHAPSVSQGRLAGRRDVPADCSDQAALAAIRARLPKEATIWCSPAIRCRMTAEALALPPPDLQQDLWEQSFGVWEGLPYDRLPNLGHLPPAALARHRPHGGESFKLMASRVRRRLRQARGETVVVAHAGTVRAALSLVTGPLALSFAIAPLSLTIMQGGGTDWSIATVNWTTPTETPNNMQDIPLGNGPLQSSH